jgi:hypothetical protein
MAGRPVPFEVSMSYLAQNFRYAHASGDYGTIAGDLVNLAIVFVLPGIILAGAWFA